MPTRTAVAPSRPPARKAAPPAADPDASLRVLRQLRHVFNAVKSHFQQVERTAGLGGAQLWALSLVRDRPGLGVSELARAMDVRQPTASNLVRSLVEQDLVAVHRSELDGRAVHLRLRPAGGRVLRKTPGPFAGVLPDALAALDPRTLKRLEADLAALNGLLETDDHPPPAARRGR